MCFFFSNKRFFGLMNVHFILNSVSDFIRASCHFANLVPRSPPQQQLTARDGAGDKKAVCQIAPNLANWLLSEH